MTRGRLASLVLVAAGAAACAKVAPPPGGPEDREPPALVSDALAPPPDAAGVPPDAPVVLVFTEGMDRRSVMRALAVFPAVDFASAAWAGDTLRLAPDPGWPAGRNTLLRVGKGAKDRRGNALPEAFLHRFTTKAKPDTGRMAGRVHAGREKTATTTLLLFAVPADTTGPDPAPAAVAEPGPDGRFTLDGLDTAVAWRIAALLDADGDSRPGGRNELWQVGEPRAFPADSAALEIPDFLVGTLDSLGRIRGDVKADSGLAAIVEARPAGAAEPAARDTLAAAGPFTLEVPTGTRYTVSAFLDLDGDAVQDPDEPAAEAAEEIRLDLASERSGVSLDLGGRAPATAADPAAAPAGAADSLAAPAGSGNGGEEDGAP